MELLSLEQRRFYSKYFLCAVFVGVIVFLVMKFAFGVSNKYFVEIYPDVRMILYVSILINLFLPDGKNKFFMYFSRVFVLASFSLLGFFTGCFVQYLSAVSK